MPVDGEAAAEGAFSAHTENERLVNSGEFSGMTAPEGGRAIVEKLAGAGARPVGDPVPAARLAALAAAVLGLPDPGRPLRALRDRGGPDDELPVLLPEVDEYLPKGRSPLPPPRTGCG